MERISVIVPVYKVEPYLDQCVESIVNQTYRELEILLIDDGSPDRCPEICDAWAEKDARIRVIHKANGGLSDARNVGMDAAEGEYIAFVDSDDFVEPEYIEYLFRALKETGADLSECGHCRTLEPLEKKEMAPPVLQTPEEALYIWSAHPQERVNCVVWDKLFRRERIEGERFALGYYGQDMLFSCRVFGKCRKIAYIENQLYHWRITPGSAMHQFPKNPLDVMEMTFRGSQYLEQNYPALAKDCKVRMCSHCIGFCYWLRYGEPVEGKAEARETMLSIRRKVTFTKEEWARCSLKEKLRILCSGPGLVGLYIRLRHLLAVRRGRRP